MEKYNKRNEDKKILLDRICKLKNANSDVKNEEFLDEIEEFVKEIF